MMIILIHLNILNLRYRKRGNKEMKIYTSYFWNLNKIPKNIVPISICVNEPYWYNGMLYKKLAPSQSIFNNWLQNHDENYYIDHYNNEILKFLSAKDIYQDFYNMTEGLDCVLLCYESPNIFCHRHLVANWLSKELSIEAKEYKK